MTRSWIVLALLVAAHPGLLDAQRRALVVFGHAGRYSSLVDLSSGGDDLAPGFAVGVGAAIQLGPRTAIRGAVTRVRSTYRGGALADSGLTRMYYGADLQLGWPTVSGFVPYLFLGGAAVATGPDDAAATVATRFGGRAGTGINYVSGFGAVFAEVLGTGYKFSGLGFERFQLDVALHAGLALALRL